MDRIGISSFGRGLVGAGFTSGKGVQRSLQSEHAQRSGMQRLGVVLSFALLATGCMSAKYATNIQYQRDAEAVLKEFRFSIKSVDFVMPSRKGSCQMFPSTPEYLATLDQDMIKNMAEKWSWNDDRWTEEMRAIAVQRYPKLFATSSDALPVMVRIQAAHANSDVATIGMIFGSLTLMSMVFPLPVWEQGRLEVSCELVLDREMMHTPLATVAVERRDMYWVTILTPFALIPVPGAADDRHTETVLAILRPDFYHHNSATHAWAMNINACLDAVVASLKASEPTIRKTIAERRSHFQY